MEENRYIFRTICIGEEEQAVSIEQICFPPHEACSEKAMKERMQVAPELFLVAYDKQEKRLAGFLNGVATDEEGFRDEFFTRAELHDMRGAGVMLLGLDVLPEYRGQGIARELVSQYVQRERSRGRKRLILTCLEEKVAMYKKMGFEDDGLANSTWGGEVWHQMTYYIER